MQVYKDNAIIPKRRRGVGLGNFDGIHLGHAALLRQLRTACAFYGIPAMVYTFESHPNNILQKEKETPIIITNDQKITLVEQKGIDELYFEQFDEAYASMAPRDFAKCILVEKLQTQIVVVGHNYTFGAFGEGTASLLAEFGKEFGFQVIVVPPVMKKLETEPEEFVVSSTVLRGLIASGRMKDYSLLTGRYYSIPGTVVEGRRVGRSLGFPTANILPKKGFALPDFGVYATLTLKDGKRYASVTNIGNNPTFEGTRPVTVETHILDFEGGLYGAEIEVYFLKKMRPQYRFETAEALQLQLAKDVEARRNLLYTPEGGVVE